VVEALRAGENVGWAWEDVARVEEGWGSAAAVRERAAVGWGCKVCGRTDKQVGLEAAECGKHSKAWQVAAGSGARQCRCAAGAQRTN